MRRQRTVRSTAHNPILCSIIDILIIVSGVKNSTRIGATTLAELSRPPGKQEAIIFSITLLNAWQTSGEAPLQDKP